jgi:DNA-binding transcriptional regulator GbsR (MarR family)
MSTLVEQIERELSATFVKHFESMGLKHTVAEAYMAVFFSDKPLGLKEISQKTGYSVSTVCTAMDILERLTDVTKTKKPGSKKVYYECLHDISVIQRKKMAEGRRYMEGMISALKAAEGRLMQERGPKADTLRDHIRMMKEDFEGFMGLMTRLEAAFVSAGK